jgi:hypothetical protein
MKKKWGFWFCHFRFEGQGRKLTFIGKSGKCVNYVKEVKRWLRKLSHSKNG